MIIPNYTLLLLLYKDPLFICIPFFLLFHRSPPPSVQLMLINKPLLYYYNIICYLLDTDKYNSKRLLQIGLRKQLLYYTLLMPSTNYKKKRLEKNQQRFV